MAFLNVLPAYPAQEGTMKSFVSIKHLFAPILVFACLLISGSLPALAQNTQVSVSPGDLSFGIPTGTSPAVSAPQTVTVNVTGSGPIHFFGASFDNPGSNSADFAFAGNSCTGTLTAPTTCQISVIFSPVTPTAGSLESATLYISSDANPNSITVPLNGALGAIKLFGPLNINPSLFHGVTWPTSAGQPTQSTTINLSCPANATARLSSSPDGRANVFQDNTIQFANSVNGQTTTTTNVCRNGDTNFGGFSGFPEGTTNCFQAPYEGAATSYTGQNPDLATAGDGGLGSFVAVFGVPPVILSSLLTPGSTDHNQLQSVTVQMTDAGGLLGSATLHLVTSCSLAGVTPGGSITGNPITPGDTSSQTQTFDFDNGGGQNISFTSSVSTAVQAGTVVVPSGTIPIVTNIGVPQSLFSQLVAGKSSAPAVCLRLAGEVDSFGNAMCKGYLIQCKDPNNGTITGDNCIPTSSTARNLFDEAKFASPDAPADGSNFLGSSCAFLLGPSGTCATSNPGGPSPMLIGPGMLLGSDKWLCPPGSDLTSCSNVQADTSFPSSPATYSAANCSLTGSLAGNLCPLDTLTQFKGAADPSHGSTTDGRNSLFIPVVNMPLPYTQTTIQGQNANGWVNHTSVSVGFVANQAAYNPLASNPPSNSFTPAPPYSVTYGITPSISLVPDTTYPVPGDQTIFGPTGTNPNFGTPLCAIGTAPASFNASASLNVTPGVYNLHYFTTDCALTEELLFTPAGLQLTNPTANWASFRTAPFGVDTNAPALSCAVTPAAPSGQHGWYVGNVTANCSATDDFSGFAPGAPVPNTNSLVMQGVGYTTPPPVSTSINPGSASATASIPQQQVSDLAGNPSNTQGPYPSPIDRALPTIGAGFSASGSTFTVGQTVSINYSCADVGSGVALCAGQVPASCPAAPAAGPGSYSPSSVIDTSAGQIGPHTFSVTATDCAGNVSAPKSVSYSIVAAAADMLIFDSPVSQSIKKGTSGAYFNGIVNLNSPTANNVMITSTFQIPNGVLNGSLSASFATVSCSIFGCSAFPNGGTPCLVSGNTITCNVGQVVSIGKGKGVVLKITIPVSANAVANTTFKAVTTVQSANDPKSSNNSSSETFIVSNK